MPSVHGIHHVTCIAADPQQNLDCYVGVMGLRLVKRLRTPAGVAW